MAHKVVITPFAYNDEYETYVWYEEQHVGLGDEFLNELEIAYRKIANNPHHYGFIDENKILRDYLIRRFPYLEYPVKLIYLFLPQPLPFLMHLET